MLISPALKLLPPPAKILILSRTADNDFLPAETLTYGPLPLIVPLNTHVLLELFSRFITIFPDLVYPLTAGKALSI